MEEHSEIFIDRDMSHFIKQKLYMGTMKAEDVRQNPELIQILQGKDLSTVFKATMYVRR